MIQYTLLAAIVLSVSSQPVPGSEADKMTFVTPGMRLVRIIDQYNKEFGTKLTVKNGLSEEVLSINAKDLSRRNFLDALAVATFAKWDDSALIDDSPRIAAAQKSANEIRAKDFIAKHKKFYEYLSKKPAYDPSALKDSLNISKPVAADGGGSRQEWTMEDYKKYMAFQELLPSTSIAETIIGMMPPSELLKLKSNERLVYSSNPNKYQLKLLVNLIGTMQQYEKHKQAFAAIAADVKLAEDDWRKYELARSVAGAKKQADLSTAKETVLIISGAIDSSYQYFSVQLQILGEKKKVLANFNGNTQMMSSEDVISQFDEYLNSKKNTDETARIEPSAFKYKPSALAQKLSKAMQSRWMFDDSDDSEDLTVQKDFLGLIFSPQLNDPLSVMSGDVLVKSAQFNNVNRFTLLPENEVFGIAAEINQSAVDQVLTTMFDKLLPEGLQSEIFVPKGIEGLRKRCNRPGMGAFTNGVVNNNRVITLGSKLIYANAVPQGDAFSSISSMYSTMMSSPMQFDEDAYWYFGVDSLRLMGALIADKPGILENEHIEKFGMFSQQTRDMIYKAVVNGQISGGPATSEADASNEMDIPSEPETTVVEGQVTTDEALDASSFDEMEYMTGADGTCFLGNGIPIDAQFVTSATTSFVLVAKSAKTSFPVVMEVSQFGSLIGSADSPDMIKYYGSIKEYKLFQIAQRTQYYFTVKTQDALFSIGSVSDIKYDKNSPTYTIDSLPPDIKKQLNQAIKDSSQIQEVPVEAAPGMQFLFKN